MDPIWIAVAFALGFLVKQVGLPPLVGFLGAGFLLHAFGAESTGAEKAIAQKQRVR
jgi:predicted Kef-type K+ transport protein